MSDFKLTSSFTIGATTKVSKYFSPSTGLSVIIGDVNGPIVEGAFAVATEPPGDGGEPHTLEHLIFLGSEDYPFKGVLDSLTNRSLARGTNAWTSLDYTAYTLSNAGSEGFLRMLPVYLDHILYPTLTESGFITEVHHIDENGQDGGVVYSEMYSRQNTSEDILHYHLHQIMYAGHAYQYESGGRTEAIRKLTIKEVRDFHKKYYRSENLSIIISGSINHNDVFKALDSIVSKIIKKKDSSSSFQRPWTSKVPPFTKTIVKTVEFPSDEEDSGNVIISWRGPFWNEFDNITAIRIMWNYLTDSAVSPLHQSFVEMEDPYCADIDFTIDENAHTIHYVEFEEVPIKKLGEMKDRFFKVIKNIISRGLDMKRMQDVILKAIIEIYNNIEEVPHRVIQSAAISHFVYGSDDSSFRVYADELSRLKSLTSKDNKFWTDLMQKYLVDLPYAVIEGKPSIRLGEQLLKEETTRLDSHKKELGDEKLKQLGKQLEDAIKSNSLAIPSSFFVNFKIPNVETISTIPLTTIRNGEILHSISDSKLLESFKTKFSSDKWKIPFFLQFDQVPSSFIQLRIVLDSSEVPDHLRSYIELYLDLMFHSPIKKGGKLIDYEEVIATLERETVNYANNVGFGSQSNFSCGVFSLFVNAELKMEITKYHKAVTWLKDILWNTVFTQERILIAATKLKGDIASCKRSGNRLASDSLNHINFRKNSNIGSLNFMAQQRFLESVIKKVKKSTTSLSIIENLDELRNILCNPKNLRIQVISDFSKISNPLSPFTSKFLPKKFKEENYISQLKKITYGSVFHSAAVKQGSKGAILSVKAIEGSYLQQSCASLDVYGHPDIPSLLVAIEMFNMMEGELFKRIRGKGFAYGFWFSLDIESGLFYFSVSEAVHLVSAYNEAQRYVQDLLTHKLEINEETLESPISGVLFSLFNREDNVENTALQSMLNYMKNVGVNQNRELAKKVQTVTKEQVLAAIEKYVKPLFNVSTSNATVACNQSQAADIQKGFLQAGRTLSPLRVEDLFL